VVQAADGNMVDQVAVLKAIADDVGDWVNQGYLPKRLIWQTLCSMAGVAFYPISSAINVNLGLEVGGDHEEIICPTYSFQRCQP
jgi:hypothetical protein